MNYIEKYNKDTDRIICECDFSDYCKQDLSLCLNCNNKQKSHSYYEEEVICSLCGHKAVYSMKAMEKHCIINWHNEE